MKIQLLFTLIATACALGMMINYQVSKADQSALGTAPDHKSASGKVEVATFAAGCFWGVQDKFDKTPGVLKTSAGYTGGRLKNPTYEDVCTHTTGHAEAVRVEFDPVVVQYRQLLDVFWKMHNPTEKNRQGPDIGDSYRSAIFYHSPEQKAEAEASLKEVNATRFAGKVVTEVVPAAEFYDAEEYHQHYFKKKGILYPVCH